MAETVAICVIALVSWHGLEMRLSPRTPEAAALSMPRLRSIGSMPTHRPQCPLYGIGQQIDALQEFESRFLGEEQVLWGQIPFSLMDPVL